MRLIDADKLLYDDITDKHGNTYMVVHAPEIDNAPTVEAVPVVHGEWEECDWVEYDGHVACSRYPKGALRCSECHNAFKKELLWKNNFCPNCGADMRKKVQE